MKKKVTTGKLVKLSNKNFTKVSFSNEVAQYRLRLEEETQLTKVVEELNQELIAFSVKHLKGRIKEGQELYEMEQEIVVYKQNQKADYTEGLKRIADEVGYEISDLLSSRKFVASLNKQFGKSVVDYLKEIQDCYSEKKKEPEIDTEKTEELKKEFRDLITKLANARIQLNTKQNELRKVKEYVSFCKDIASIATLGETKSK